ncbi:MAG: ATP-binding protein [Ignavibacteriaceae bacterium]|nr:ATP-binding protein [Ignavibacteriaceae bacterium]
MKIDLKASESLELPFHTVVSLNERLAWLINLRWISIIALLFCIPIADKMLGFNIGFNEITNLAVILLVINILYFFIARYFQFKNEYQELAFLELQILIDLLVISFMIHYSGGIGNPFYYLYLVQVILSGIIFPGKALPYINAFAAALLLTIWTILEHVIMFDRYLLRSEPASLALIITSLIAFYIINFAGIYIINTFMNGYRSLKRIIDQKNVQLEQSIKDRSRTFRFAAHELKSPLIAIQSTLEVVKSLFSEDLRKEVKDMVLKAEKRSSQVIDMIKEMITVTQYNLGMEKPVFENVDFDEWLFGIVSHHKVYANKKNLELVYNHLSFSLNINIDVNGYEKVVSNLVSNGLRYTPSGGKVIVEPFVSDYSYGLVVKDTGIGIPKEDMEKIFEEFYRSKNAREAEQIGTGLGLNLVKEIVYLYEGEISVKSEIGKGSEFKVEFPLKEKQSGNEYAEELKQSVNL